MRKMLKNAGLTIIDSEDTQNVTQIIREALLMYDIAMDDPTMCRAAYGLAVGGICIALNISLRTARLLIEHALALRELQNTKPETVCQIMTLVPHQR